MKKGETAGNQLMQSEGTSGRLMKNIQQTAIELKFSSLVSTLTIRENVLLPLVFESSSRS